MDGHLSHKQPMMLCLWHVTGMCVNGCVFVLQVYYLLHSLYHTSPSLSFYYTYHSNPHHFPLHPPQPRLNPTLHSTRIALPNITLPQVPRDVLISATLELIAGPPGIPLGATSHTVVAAAPLSLFTMPSQDTLVLSVGHHTVGVM